MLPLAAGWFLYYCCCTLLSHCYDPLLVTAASSSSEALLLHLVGPGAAQPTSDAAVARAAVRCCPTASLARSGPLPATVSDDIAGGPYSASALVDT